MLHTSWNRIGAGVVLLGCMQLAWAQFDPAKTVPERTPVAVQFPDPVLGYDTPGFAEGRKDFASHAEVFQFMLALAKRSPHVALEALGHSQEGRAMTLLVLSGSGGFDATRPTVMLLGQQHGNEPAGGEAALVLAQMLATERSALLDQVNVLVVPRANPDGAERFGRVSSSGLDINRDHLLVRTPEAQALTAAIRRYRPQVMLDLHEFTVAGRWVDKFGAVMRYDALLQAATVGNLSPAIAAVQTRYLEAARQGIEATGQRVSDYFTTSPDPANKVVAMGGINVDTGRNVGGLRNAVSILLETRGVGLGRAHFARRVQAHVAAAMAIVETAARDGRALVQATREAGRATGAQACRSDLTIASRQTPQRRMLDFLDAQSGEAREIDVEWRSSLVLQTVRQRARPCGYLLSPEQGAAVERLRTLGVSVQQVATPWSGPAWSVEDYVVEAEETGRRQDGRGAIEDDDDIRVLKVALDAHAMRPPAGSFYVPMAQPLAGLVSAALEPDSQNSFAANRVLDIGNGGLRRVTRLPADAQLRPLPLR